ncbi:MAG: ROK family protein [Candidatus Carbobacillus sp.]|nr:ROK family protein [Candidatus Carbobacillus sp.]
MQYTPIFAGLEAGGTKMVCGLGRWEAHTGSWQILERITVPTRAPAETMEAISAFFMEQTYGDIQALGIAAFGPLDLSPNSPTYGSITTTPKLAWRHYPIKNVLEAQLGVPVAIDTDVAGAALGEARFGAGKGAQHLVYMTVGTGIGVGIILNGAIARGLTHPEFGHINVRKAPSDDFPGVCPYHGDCLEGLASGSAIEKRAGQAGDTLPPDHPVWEDVAYALGEAVVTLLLTVGPEKVVLGGGVMKQASLFPRIRRHVIDALNGYLMHPLLPEHVQALIVPPGLGDLSGLYGALELARMHRDG